MCIRDSYYPFSTFKRVSVKNLLTLISTLKDAKDTSGSKSPKGAKGTKVAKDAKVPKVTRHHGTKGLLGDKVFSRTCVQSSLTPEEGPSC